MFKTLSLPQTIHAPVARRSSVSKYAVHVRPLYVVISYALVGLNVALLLSYFVGVNRYTSAGYEIKQMHGNISKLVEENKKLTVRVSEQSSMTQLQNEIAANPSYVSAGSPVYVQVNQYSKK